ncbi:MAG: sigma-54 interaction domain-containing protein [Desulfomonilaceae bacterium]
MDGLIVIDTDGMIVSVNHATERMTGYSKEELIGSPCTILACDRCGARPREDGTFTCNLFETGIEERRKCTMQKKDGSSLPVMKNASLLVGKDKRVIGAVETLTDLSEIASKERQIAKLSALLRKQDQFQGIVGRSPLMRQVFELVADAAVSDAPIIIYGETGTGKELVATAIHQLGTRKHGPFVKVNCAALSETLLESELFGHVKGAYTGAYKSRQGRFELADKGDIFLDEIGDIPPSMQVKILRVLQEKEFERVGDSAPIKVDVRIISATHRDLFEMTANNQFREDLFYRLNVIPIRLPPLRERLEDLPLLVTHLLETRRLITGKNISGISQDAMKLLTQYRWPGNIRELINAIDYAFVVCRTDCIEVDNLPDTITDDTKLSTGRKSHLRDREDVLEALRRAGGKRGVAAKYLGISRQALWKKMAKLGIKMDFAVKTEQTEPPVMPK